MNATAVNNILILYPWQDIKERTSGASLRTGLLIEHLKGRYSEIKVLVPGGGSTEKNGNVEYSSYSHTKWQNMVLWFFKKLFFLTVRLMIGFTPHKKTKHRNHYLLWWQIEDYIVKSRSRKVEELVRWADVVLLEYTFWAQPVIKACKKYNKKLIITDHDVVAQQIPSRSVLHRISLNIELEALKQADHAVCVSMDDEVSFREMGVEIVCIPHGIEMPGPDKKTTQENIVILENLTGYNFSGRSVCLFVGSMIKPNIKAVKTLREMTNKIQTGNNNGADVVFVVVGSCCEPEENENFVALGKVPHEALKTLYRMADVVVIPLALGTGASLKTIEAMAYGKVVIGSNIAYRGYPVTSGHDSIIEDDFMKYPEIIKNILSSSEQRQILEARAREFAKAYSYQNVYKRYEELIER